ncbi:YhdP family protein [Pararhizobium sp.]|uniref:YhdP family protein n=1 Tax=Pararhizobium sp. TaxID=1977563 RepID=UPI00271C1CCB|nr:hypothetical protein [Pararhizobium sp.]MDO9415318.1 DUF3971 domain-containing protein [Pararhizobium sp.]
MDDIRSEKVVFRKQDIVDLHTLPSACAFDPIIVHAPKAGGSLMGRLVKILIWLSLFAALLFAGAVAAIETGMLDAPLNDRASQALNNAIGKGYHAEVASTVVRFSDTGGLALKAQGVKLIENSSGKTLATTKAVSIALDPLALFKGQIAVSLIEAEGAMLDQKLLPQGKPLDLSQLRIGNIPVNLEAAFANIDRISGFIGRSRTKTMRISDFTLSVLGPKKKIVPILIDTLDFTRAADGSMKITGAIKIDGAASSLVVDAANTKGSISRISGTFSDLELDAFLVGHNASGAIIGGLDTQFDVDMNAVRGGEAQKPALDLTISADDGTLHFESLSSQLRSSKLKVAYDFGRNSVEVMRSTINFGASSFPVTGAIIDLGRVDATQKNGFAINLLFSSAVSAPVDVSEAPLVFDANLNGRYLPDTRELVFSEAGISSALGSVAGSIALKFGDKAPKLTLVALADKLESSAVKQMWPWWMAKAPRRWVIANLYGGTVSNGRIELALPEGRLDALPGPLRLNAEELKIQFDIAGARMNVAGDIPPIRDTSAKFSLKGERVEIGITGGTAYFPSGRSVVLESGDFLIPKSYEKPLMAEMKIGVSGSADSIAELVTYKPIQALQRTTFVPEDFTGSVKGLVGARFGLVADQKPPVPEWQVAMELDDVAVNKPISGRMISGLNGTFRIDPRQAELTSKAKIDDIVMDLSLVEPVDPKGGVTRQRQISGTLESAELAKFAPGLGNIINGSVGLAITIDAEGKNQTIEADLSRATVSIPWIGWTKGKGIAAKAEFTAVSEEGVTDISDFNLTGEDFGARGKLQTDKSGLVSASFSRVRLSAIDDYALEVKRQKGGYSVSVNGSSADIRPVLARLREPKSDGDKGSDGVNATIRVKLDQTTGFNGEVLKNLALTYGMRDGKPSTVDMSAVTDSGQAVVAHLDKAGSIMELTSGDAGGLARFADIYRNMRGGLLNLKLIADEADSWRGTVDIRTFSLINEQRLKSIVATPAGEDGRSLNQAVKRDIDVSAVRFERGFANLFSQDGVMRVERGVVRGPEVGATFQGVVRDKRGRTDMTGTFMPAYGLNRLFAELPIIGILLGNGRDRGLIGITFKLSGPFEKPSLTINPLSLIAPGVFRSIFEFK